MIEAIMAYCVLGYDYIEKHTTGDPLNGGEPDEELLAAARFVSPFYQVNSDTPPIYLIHGEKDLAVAIHHAYALELQAKIYMDEENVKTAYWPEAEHVDKKFFDSYAQYTSSYEFVEAKRQAFLSADQPDEPDVTDPADPTAPSNPSGTEPDDQNNGSGLVWILVGVAVVAAVVVVVVILKRKRG